MNRFDLVVVRGSGDVGSAVAHALYMRGAKVILHDEPAPAHPRRGMAFCDALFAGRSTLDGVVARHARDLGDVLTIGAVGEEVPVCDAPLQALVAEYEPDALVDARMRKRATIEDQRPLAPTTIGLGPGFHAGINCSLAIETAWGDELGRVVRSGGTRELSGEPRPLGGAGRERFVYAPLAGRWITSLAIGDTVTAGQEIGRIDRHSVQAPFDGVLRGLSHDGVMVALHQKMVEVAPDTSARVTGQGERPRAIAKGVLRALELHPEAQLQFFQFERGFESSLDCIPMSVRLKLDLCGLKLSLAQWRALPVNARRTMLDAQCTCAVDVRRLRRFIELSITSEGGGCPKPGHLPEADWQNLGQVPEQVRAVLATAELPAISLQAWSQLGELERFALCKLTGKGHQRNLVAALAEFGLISYAS